MKNNENIINDIIENEIETRMKAIYDNLYEANKMIDCVIITSCLPIIIVGVVVMIAIVLKLITVGYL